MTKFEISESISCALDSLDLAIDSLNAIEHFNDELDRIIGKIQNSYDELLMLYKKHE